MKALNNYVSSAGLIAAVEALLIGRKFGLDPALTTDILNASSGKNNTTERKLKQFIISETFADGFPLRLMAKDVRTADDMAHALGIPTPMADLCAQLWEGRGAGVGREGQSHRSAAVYGGAGRVSVRRHSYPENEGPRTVVRGPKSEGLC
jgi:3-hydroxyisobutyrate dehydrogenase